MGPRELGGGTLAWSGLGTGALGPPAWRLGIRGRTLALSRAVATAFQRGNVNLSASTFEPSITVEEATGWADQDFGEHQI